MRRTRTVTSVSACLALSAVGIAAAPVDAADLADPITELTVSGQAAVPGDVLTLSAAWQVPDHSAAGDSFTLHLPAELVPLATDFPLATEAGDVVATAHVADGKVTVTLTDFVTTHPINIHGSLRFSARVVDSAQPGTRITVSWGGQTRVITVGQGEGIGPGPSEPNKYMWQREGTVGSAIDIPGQLSDAVVTDRPENMRIICSSLSITTGEIHDGAYPTAWEPVTPRELSCTEEGFVLGLPEIEADTMTHIVYDSVPVQGATEAVNTYDVVGAQRHGGGTVTKTLLNGSGSASAEEDRLPVTPAPTVTPTPTATPTPSVPAQPSPSTSTPVEPSPTPSSSASTPPTPSAPTEPSPTTGIPEEPSPSATPTAGTTPEPVRSTPQISAAPAAAAAPSSPASGPGTTGSAQQPQSGQGTLAHTGAQTTAAAVGGIALLAAGALVLVMTRRRDS